MTGVCLKQSRALVRTGLKVSYSPRSGPGLAHFRAWSRVSLNLRSQRATPCSFVPAWWITATIR